MRIVTYNIRGGLGMDDQRSTARVAATVRAHRPDVVCFQEVHQRLPWSHMIDQPRELKRLLGMPVTFHRVLRLGMSAYGVAVASPLPVMGKKEHLLPSVKEQRGALEVRLDTPGIGPVTIFCTHWGLGEDERARQAVALAEAVNAAPGPVVVCGDFNERADARGVQTLLSMTGLRDADASADRPTFPSGSAARARIDFVLHSADLAASEVSVDAASLASDHHLVRADLVPTVAREGGAL